MDLERRIRAVERVPGERGECVVCRDAGCVLTVVGDNEEEPEPRACPARGQVYKRQAVVVVEQGRDGLSNRWSMRRTKR